ncbi:hypothetical protein D3C73_616090 [compost metagenome]
MIKRKRENKELALLHQLDMGLIKQYSMIIPAQELEQWTAKGWHEDQSFTDFHYSAEEGEAMLLSRPRQLKEIEADGLLNSRIVDLSSNLGTYGMGGPGFFGLQLELDGREQYLVYAVWASGQYIMMDGRVIECYLNYNKSHRPWMSRWAGEPEEQQWDELSEVLKRSVITGITLSDAELSLDLASGDGRHQLVFYRYHESLPPMGGGGPRKEAFEQGVIGDYIVFSEVNAVLHV